MEGGKGRSEVEEGVEIEKVRGRKGRWRFGKDGERKGRGEEVEESERVMRGNMMMRVVGVSGKKFWIMFEAQNGRCMTSCGFAGK